MKPEQPPADQPRLGTRLRRAIGDADRQLSARLQLDDRQRFAFRLAWWGAHLGDGYVWFVVALAALWLGDVALRRGILGWIISMALAGAITTSTKFVLRRRRPHEQGGFYSVKYDQHSFPSGHATRMGTIAVWGLLLFSGWGWLLVGLAAWTSWSRVALRVHYLLDVVSGLLVGGVVSWVVWIVLVGG